MDREEYERLLQVANQLNLAVHNEEEDNIFSYRYRQNDSNPNYRSESNPRTSHQLENSTEFPGHDYIASMLSKVCHRMSDILPHPHENDEEIG